MKAFLLVCLVLVPTMSFATQSITITPGSTVTLTPNVEVAVTCSASATNTTPTCDKTSSSNCVLLPVGSVCDDFGKPAHCLQNSISSTGERYCTCH